MLHLSNEIQDFEILAQNDNTIKMNTHFESKTDNTAIVKILSVKSAFSIKSGVLYKDGSFQSRSYFFKHFKKYQEFDHTEIYTHINRPRDRDTGELLQALGWTVNGIKPYQPY